MTVIIDPSTGKLIDIESFNYYYDYAVGSNSLTFTRRYPSMTLYKYGNWGDNMKISINLPVDGSIITVTALKSCHKLFSLYAPVHLQWTL